MQNESTAPQKTSKIVRKMASIDWVTAATLAGRNPIQRIKITFSKFDIATMSHFMLT